MAGIECQGKGRRRDNGGCEAGFGGLKKGKKVEVNLDFRENRGGWGNKKATASVKACRGYN